MEASPETRREMATVDEILAWKRKFNDRRLMLLARKYNGGLDDQERAELDRLQAEVESFQLRRREIPGSPSRENEVG
jgi:hypothetical protein